MKDVAASRQHPSSATRSLTAREAEVLHWIAEGKTNAAIAIILGLSPSTVKCHVERILQKLGVENRTAAARVAFHDGNAGVRRSADFHDIPKHGKTVSFLPQNSVRNSVPRPA